MSRLDAWSRRRAAVEAEEQAIKAASAARAREAEDAELEARSDDDVLQELGLAEPETLETPEAVREFLNAAVPQRLKTRALRRLWRLNPVLANVDGLVDYGEDFTDAANVVEHLQTAYQVGKGMLAHVEALAAADVDEDRNASSEENTEIVDEASESPIADTKQEAPGTPDVPQTSVAVDPDDPSPAMARRRMAFSFTTSDTESPA